MPAKTGAHSFNCQADPSPVSAVSRYRRVIFEVGDLSGRIRQLVDASGLSDRAYAMNCALHPNILSTLVPRLLRDPYAVELKTLAAIAKGGGMILKALPFSDE